MKYMDFCCQHLSIKSCCRVAVNPILDGLLGTWILSQKTLPLPCGMLISTLRVEISIPQGKEMGMCDYNAVLRLRVKWPIFKPPRVGTALTIHNRIKTHRRQIIAVNAVTFVKMSYQQHHNQIGTISPENTRDPCCISCQTTRNQSGVGSRSQLYQIYNNIINPHELVRPTHSRDIECWIISLSALLVIPVCESSQPHYSLCSTFLMLFLTNGPIIFHQFTSYRKSKWVCACIVDPESP